MAANECPDPLDAGVRVLGVRDVRHVQALHHCFNCGGEIPWGETAQRVALVEGRSVYNWWRCSICQRIGRR